MRLRFLSLALVVVGVLLLGGGVVLGTRPTTSTPSHLYATAGPAAVDGSVTICTFGSPSSAESCEAYFELAGADTLYAMRGNDFVPSMSGTMFESEPTVSLVYRTDGPVHIDKPLPSGDRIDGDFFVVVQLAVVGAGSTPTTQYTNAEYRTYLAGTREDLASVARRGLPLGAPGLALLVVGLALLIVSLVRGRTAPVQPAVPAVPEPVPVGAGVVAGGAPSVPQGIAAYQPPYQITEDGPPAPPRTVPPVAEPVEGDSSGLLAEWPALPSEAPIPAPQPAPPDARQPWYRQLGRPLPRVALVGTGVVAALALIGLQVTGFDWAAGAIRMGIGAAVVAGLVALATLVQALVNRGQPNTQGVVARFAAPGITVALLVALTGSAFGLQAPIHSGQALFLDRGENWEQAIDEYKLAGERSPNSASLAGVYNDWGEHLSTGQQFADAIDKFGTVLQDYNEAGSEVQRAQKDTVAAYLGWGKQAADQHNDEEATQHYDALLALSFCDAGCQAQASGLDATAYYNLAEADLASGQYGGAVAAFTAVASRFATSPEANQIHADFARALLGFGRQEATQNSCTAALATYQQLTSGFSDTPEAKQAMADLAAPQPVKGSFDPPIPSGATVFLGKGLTRDTPSDQFVAILNKAPKTGVASDGSFQFDPLPQGTYDLVWGFPLDSETDVFLQVFNNDGTPYYVATVGPLCAFDFGTIDTPFVPPNIPFAAKIHAQEWVVHDGRVSAMLAR